MEKTKALLEDFKKKLEDTEKQLSDMQAFKLRLLGGIETCEAILKESEAIEGEVVKEGEATLKKVKEAAETLEVKIPEDK